MWWELRRFLFNIFLFILSFLALKIIKINYLTVEMGSGQYFIFLSFLGIIIILNIIYTFGWVVELFKNRSLTFGPRIFKKLVWNSFMILFLATSIYYFILQ